MPGPTSSYVDPLQEMVSYPGRYATATYWLVALVLSGYVPVVEPASLTAEQQQVIETLLADAGGTFTLYADDWITLDKDRRYQHRIVVTYPAGLFRSLREIYGEWPGRLAIESISYLALTDGQAYDPKGYTGIRKALRADVNGNGPQEHILAVQFSGLADLSPDGEPSIEPKVPVAAVLICEEREGMLVLQHWIPLGHILPEFELADVDRDGIQDVIAHGAEPMDWSFLTIVGWQHDRYVVLWNSRDHGSAAEHIFGLDENGNARVDVRLPRRYLSTEHGGGYSDVEEWETWLWDWHRFGRVGE